MKKRLTEEQIIGFLAEAEAGLSVKELCRKLGFSEASYYRWKAKFGGMKGSKAAGTRHQLSTLEERRHLPAHICYGKQLIHRLSRDLKPDGLSLN